MICCPSTYPLYANYPATYAATPIYLELEMRKQNMASIVDYMNYLLAQQSVQTYTETDRKHYACRWKNCQLTFDSLTSLSQHIAGDHSSSRAGLFYCEWDNCARNYKSFNARYKMLVHVRTHTNEKPHACDQCAKAFSRAENLKIHMRSHSGERPYVCAIVGCAKAFSNSSDRFKHTRTHQVDKPYVCKVPGCTKRYTDPSSLRKHVKTNRHNGPGSFVTLDELIKDVSTCDDDLWPFGASSREFETPRSIYRRHAEYLTRDKADYARSLSFTEDSTRAVDAGALTRATQRALSESMSDCVDLRREDVFDSFDMPLDLRVSRG